MRVVFNSSPWIALSKLGGIEQAMELFDEVLIPSSVWEEVLGRGDEASVALERLQRRQRVQVVRAKEVRLVNAMRRRLGKGEAEAIWVALEREADWVLLDDEVARKEAMRLDLRVKGTLGIVRRLMEKGRFDRDLSELYTQLRQIGFRVTERIFWDIFRGIC